MKKKLDDADYNDLLEIIIEAIRSRKGEAITFLDLTHLNTTISRSFLISHAGSTVQAKAIAEAIEVQVRDKARRRPYHREGYDNSQWVLLDYGDVIVHVFQKPFRDFYNLEELWADGHRTDFTS
ncbi:MAG: ribosome silencing factor [Bacteroidia bacterium]|nr:ribosome silencing factor [Bacteroidia bacterium]